MDLVLVLKWVKSVIGCTLYIFHLSDYWSKRLLKLGTKPVSEQISMDCMQLIFESSAFSTKSVLCRNIIVWIYNFHFFHQITHGLLFCSFRTKIITKLAIQMVFFQWAIPGLFCSFSFFSNNLQKTVDFSGIRTRIVGIDGKHADH